MNLLFQKSDMEKKNKSYSYVEVLLHKQEKSRHSFWKPKNATHKKEGFHYLSFLHRFAYKFKVSITTQQQIMLMNT